MTGLDIADCINETRPWSGEPVHAGSLTGHDGKVAGFCNPGCRDRFGPRSVTSRRRPEPPGSVSLADEEMKGNQRW